LKDFTRVSTVSFNPGPFRKGRAAEEIYIPLVHSHPLQVALDSGLLGLCVLSATMLLFIKQWLKARKTPGVAQRLLWPALLIVAVFFTHSLLDINMNYPAIANVFFLLLAVPAILQNSRAKPHLRNRLSTTAFKTAISGLSLVIITGAFMLWQAEFLEAKADKQSDQNKNNAAIETYKRALHWNPFSAPIHTKIGLLYEKEAYSTKDTKYLTLAAGEHRKS